jgi:hypothetical protein
VKLKVSLTHTPFNIIYPVFLRVFAKNRIELSFFEDIF